MINSIKKGKAGEREFANFCNKVGFKCRRGQQYSGLGGDDVVGLEGFHIEVKRVEKLNIDNAMKQSIKDSKGNIPIVAHRKNRKDWLVTLRAEDFLKLIKT